MLEYEVARELYGELKDKSSNASEDIKELYTDFLKTAVDYAKTRTDWSFMTFEERIDEDQGRTYKHNAVISMLTAICRNLGVDRLESIAPDRKTKGDFACYVALFLGIEQR